MNNFASNKIMDFNSSKRLNLNVNNNSKKNTRANNGFEINNNSIENNHNANSLLNNKSSRFSLNSLSLFFENSIIYRNNPKHSLYKNHSKNDSFKSYKDYRNSQNRCNSFTYQSPQILKDLKQSETQKPKNIREINLNINNNNANINKCLYNFSNIDNEIDNYTSKKNGNLNLYQYNNYIIKYNINMHENKPLISPDVTNNSNNKCSLISKSIRINKSNDCKIFKRLYNNNNLINSNNNVNKFLYQSSSSKSNKNIINYNNI